MTLLFLFHLQVALNGFHALDLPDLCYDPLLSLFVMYETRENNIPILLYDALPHVRTSNPTAYPSPKGEGPNFPLISVHLS
jgi:hypothetical protein